MAAMLSAQDVLNQKFSATKFRLGYDVESVDDFLDEVVRALTSWASGVRPALTAEGVRAPRFPATKFREGYSQEEVDDFLNEVARTLRTYEEGAATADRPASPAEQVVSARPVSGTNINNLFGIGGAVGVGGQVGVGPFSTDAPVVTATAVGLREATSQLQYAAVRAAGSDTVRVLGPDGRPWVIVGVDATPDGVVIHIA